MRPRRIAADLQIYARNYVRNPAALFFTFFFPVILIALFGVIFSSSGPNPVKIVATNLDSNSNISIQFLSALNKTGAVTISVVGPPSNQTFASYLSKSGDSFGLVIPAGFAQAYYARQPVNITLYVNPQDPSGTGITEGAVAGVANAFNLKASNGSEVVRTQTQLVGSQVFKYIDYLVPGLIGFAILTTPMFSIAELSATYRKEGLFRQLSLTPLTRGEWLVAKIMWYTALSIISAVIMVAVGSLVFHSQVTLTLGVIPFLLLGPFLFVSLGILAGSASPTPESAAIVANVVTFPMMFLSGTFFPVSSFSPFLQNIAHILPLFYIIDGMNQVMLFGNAVRAATDFGIVLALAIVVFIAGIYTFRWRDNK
jgi:ABC-2 type transport system permease protein